MKRIFLKQMKGHIKKTFHKSFMPAAMLTHSKTTLRAGFVFILSYTSRNT